MDFRINLIKNMINYVLMYNDLVDSNNMFSLITWESFLFFVFICIFLLSLPALIFSASKEEIKKQKLFYRKISFTEIVKSTERFLKELAQYLLMKRNIKIHSEIEE